MTTSPKTFRRTFARTLGHNLLAALALGVVLIFGMATQGKESVQRPAVVNAETIAAQHGCDNPEDPAHAVVTVDGHTRYVGQRLTDKAIEQAVFGIEHGLIVHNFCP